MGSIDKNCIIDPTLKQNGDSLSQALQTALDNTRTGYCGKNLVKALVRPRIFAAFSARWKRKNLKRPSVDEALARISPRCFLCARVRLRDFNVTSRKLKCLYDVHTICVDAFSGDLQLTYRYCRIMQLGSYLICRALIRQRLKPGSTKLETSFPSAKTSSLHCSL